MTKLPFETERLILRSFQDSDIEPFSAYRSKPEVAQFQDWEAPFSVAQATGFVEHMKEAHFAVAGEWYQIAIEHKGTGELIGDCAFHIFAEDSKQAEIGYTLSPASQKKGYAVESVKRLLDFLFHDLNLHRVRATCDVENTASFKLLERLGMRREAHLIENIWFKGRWGSEYVYAILYREWGCSS